MKLSYIKFKKDDQSFRIPKLFGSNVIELEDEEAVDKNIEDLIKQKYDTIILSNEIAGNSENIIKKYSNKKSINIIIAPAKEI